MADPTKWQYGELDSHYRFFNEALFDSTLPPCLITLQRKSKTRGYFHGNRFVTRDGAEVADEIALNPSLFKERTVEQVLSTLVHEMVHLWQHHYGTPSRITYHNREWADKMEVVGLIPSDTGEPGGKRTGQRVTHYIAPDGPFERAVGVLLFEGGTLPYVQRTDDPVAAKKTASKTKFTCPVCHANAWGKPDLLLICGTDGGHMVAA